MVAPLIIGGIIAGVSGIGGLAWYLWRRSRRGRIGLEREEIMEDVELQREDREIRRTEKEERYQSEYLKDLLYAVHKRAINLGLGDYEKRNILILDYISRELRLLIKEDILLSQEEELLRKKYSEIQKERGA